LKRGVITASAGNHAQGVALSAQVLGCEATIVMPATTPAIKVDAVRASGGARWCCTATPMTMPTEHATSLAKAEGRPSCIPTTTRM
jgi:threonine dehydratase